MNPETRATKGQEFELEVIADAIERLATSKSVDGKDCGCNGAVFAVLRTLEMQGMHTLSIDAGIADYLMDRAERQLAEIGEDK